MGGIRAPSTLGSFLRAFTWGNVLQLEKVSRLLLAGLAGRGPLLPGKDTVAFLDIDSMQKRVYGHAKQGAAFGHTKIQGKSLLVRGLNALAATTSTPLAAPMIAGTGLRGGNAGSARGAASFATALVNTARAAGCTGILLARADSAFYSRRPRSGRSSRTPGSTRRRAGTARAGPSSFGPRRRGSWRWTTSPPTCSKASRSISWPSSSTARAGSGSSVPPSTRPNPG